MQRAAFRKTDFINKIQPDTRPAKMVIAIDGPAASGKGTLAKKIAERLGYAHLDSGALYRAIALATLEMAGNPAKIEDVRRGISVIEHNLTPELLSSPTLRTPKVSEAASLVAAHPEVRGYLLDYQRNFAKTIPDGMGGVVIDGRDIGTVVCPDADVKLYVTASAEVRADRVFKDLQKKNISANYDAVLDDIKRRDARDMGRMVAPLKAAKDAFVLDTSTLDPSRALDQALVLIRAKLIAATAEI